MAVYTKNVGRVIIKHVGNYDSARDYVPLELVYHDGSTYCCKEPTTGNAPPNASYWILMSTSACTLDKQAAEAAAAAAQGSANDAAAQVTAAQQQVTHAQGHANTASTKATEATNKATDAANSASQAQGHAGDAEQSATEAASSASSAADSATQAQQAASSVNGPALQNQLDNHKHDGTAGNGVMINYADLTGTPDIADILLAIYPVGAIYISYESTSPATLFGGTWAALGGRMLIGADETYTAGSTGGAATHQLTLAEMVEHSHWVPLTGDIAGTPGHAGLQGVSTAYNYQYGVQTVNKVTSGMNGTPWNQLPPYLAVYMWKRTA